MLNDKLSCDRLGLVRWLFTAFLLVLVPVYLYRYGPTNFLYFCDLALLLTGLSLWTRWRLPASMAAVAILVPQAHLLQHFRKIIGFPANPRGGLR